MRLLATHVLGDPQRSVHLDFAQRRIWNLIFIQSSPQGDLLNIHLRATHVTSCRLYGDDDFSS